MSNWYRELRNLMESSQVNPKVLELVNKILDSNKSLIGINIRPGMGVLTTLSQEAKTRGLEFHEIFVDQMTADSKLPVISSKAIVVLQGVDKASPEALQACSKLADADCKVIKVTYN